MYRLLWRVSFCFSLGGLVFCLRYPVHSGVSRIGMLLAIVGLIIVTGMGLWRVHRGLAILPVLLLLPFALPGWNLDRGKLKEAYLVNMQGMEGKLYHWGGESLRGIDCSGLPRLAMREALLEQWWNGRAWRKWAELWWWDASAKAMSEGYRGLTTTTGVSGILKELDESELEAGDLAVTRGGVHVMIFLGDGLWIQADPKPMKVVISGAKNGENSWFDLPVSLHRWTLI